MQLQKHDLSHQIKVDDAINQLQIEIFSPLDDKHLLVIDLDIFHPSITQDQISTATVDVDNDGLDEIVVEINSLGTTCCTSLAIIFFDEVEDVYKISPFISRNWSIAPRVIDVNGDQQLEFLTRDPSHPWVAPPAVAVSPIQIFVFESGEFIDRTSEFPDIVYDDAMLWLASCQGEIAELSEEYLQISQENPEYWSKQVFQVEMVLATYLFEMQLLGRLAEARENLEEVCQTNVCRQFVQSLEIF